MTKQEMIDFFSGKDEVEINNELIELLRENDSWSEDDIEFLKEAGEDGAKYNIKRDSIVFPFF